REGCPQRLCRSSGPGVGTDDYRLDSLRDQKPRDLQSTVTDERGRLVAPRRVRGVGHVVDGLGGQRLVNLLQHGLSADARMEGPDGRVVTAERLAGPDL